MYRLNEQEIFYDTTDGQAIIINSLNGCYYSMDVPSSSVFECLISGCPDGAITEALAGMPGCPEDIKCRLSTFIDQLMAESILLRREGVEKAICKCGLALDKIGPEFNFCFEKFTDMQDLLLSDPIHDASPEVGWPVMKPDEKKSGER